MFRKILKSVIFPSLFLGSLFLVSAGLYADDLEAYEVLLQKQGSSLISEVIIQRDRFNSVAVSLDEEVEGLEANFGNGWLEVEIHNDGFGAGRLVFTQPSNRMQFRIPAEGRSSLKLKAEPFLSDENGYGGPGNLQASSTLLAQNHRIIKRNEWGADEDMRIWNPDRVTSSGSSGTRVDPCADIERNYASDFKLSKVEDYTSDGQPLTWPLQHAASLEKFTVHHTDSDLRDLNGDSHLDSRDYSAMVRAIYQYHTLSRGWGDIGYNYIIDPLGNIYEGRYGGDKVIGAHALCYNHGVMGIAIIGDYEENEVPEPALNAMIYLIGQKSKTHKIDPKAFTDFRGKRLGNVFGHKDVRSTSCPGKNLYSQLPRIRDRASLIARNFSESSLSVAEYDYNAELSNTFATAKLDPGERKKVTLKFKNTGTKTWDDTTWLHAALNNDPNARVVPAVEGKNFVAADLQENKVAPGDTGTFTVEIEGGFKPGYYAFELSPVVNGRFKISRASQFLGFNVTAPNYDYEVVSHEFPKGNAFQGQNIVATLKLKNTGNTTWRNFGRTPITLGTTAPNDRESMFIKNNPSRVGYMIQSEVAPGEIADFALNLFVPDDREGEVIERFQPVIENVGWLDDKALGFKVFVKEPVHLAKTTKLERLGYMFPGERRYVTVEMKNLGDLPWNSQTVETTLLGRGMKVFKRMLLPNETVYPGDSTEVGFWVEAPLEAGQHSVYLRSRFNGKPIRGAVARFIVEVPSPELRGAKVEQTTAFAEAKPGQARTLEVKFKNTGNTVWKKKGYHAVRLGTALPHDRESDLLHEASWVNKARPAELQEEEVEPGEVGTFKFKVYADRAGRYEENFQLVMERFGWIAGASVKWVVDVKADANVSNETTFAPSVISASVLDAAPEEPKVELASEPAATPAVPTQSDEEPFRVRLSHSATQASLTADTSFLVTNENNQALFNYSAGKKVNVRKVGNGFEVSIGTNKRTAKVVRLVPKSSNGITEILSMERRPSWNESLNDNRFRGVVEMRLVDGEVAYINELPLEHYMRGLAEVSNSAHGEKQKTIAVLARTYARYYMDPDNRKFPGKSYDGNDDPAVFQRYLGYGVEARSPNFVKAVEATEDMVVTYKGQLVKTPYFNQSDGRTRSAQEVWGWTHTPYLKSVSDPWSNGLQLKGHGVGLSGHGATAQALEGKSFEQIIKYYYTDVAIEKMNF